MKNLFISVIALMFSFLVMAQPAKLALNLETGKMYKVKNSSQQTIQASVNGQQFTSEVYNNIFISFKVLSQAKDIMQIEFKFDTIENKVNSPMAKRETNSAKPAKSKEYLAKIMNRISTYKLIAKISTSGKFIGFVNYKNFKDSVLMEMDSVPDTKKDQIQKQADGVLGESTLQSMIEPNFVHLPEKTVNVGDKWDRSFSINSSVASMILFNSYTLNSIEGKSAKMSCSSQIESLPSNDAKPQISMDVKGNSTSDLNVDLGTGLSIKNSTKSHVEGTMTVNNQGNEMKMPVVVDSHSENNKIE